MAVSLTTLVPRLRTILGELSDQTWVTQGSAASAVSVVAVTDGTQWDVGAVGEFQNTGFEQFKVLSISVNNLTCIRGWGGTTAASQAASSTIIRDPIITGQNATDSLTQAMQRAWPYVYIVGSQPITPSTTTMWYNLNALDIELLGARQKYGTTTLAFGEWVTGTARRPTNKKFAYFSRELDTSIAASGVGIRFKNNSFFHVTNTVTVRTKRLLTGTSDIEDTQELPVAEALIIGAIPRVLAEVQLRRILYTPNLQQAQQLGGLVPLQAASGYEQQFQTMLFHLKLKHDELYIVGGQGWGVGY